MKFLYDFFPIVLFFVAFKLYGIYTATAVAIAASVLQVAIYWLKYRKFENMHLITLAIITVFGGATLLLEDEIFIKWKPTVLNWLFAIVFLGSQFIGKKTIVERVMGANIQLKAAEWIKLNLSWVVFFVALGALNLYVLYNYDTDTWVNFKLFGMLGLSLVFMIIQTSYIMRLNGPKDSKEQHNNSKGQ
jgi:intracellular septation protein